jgi:hypothetical protein
LLEEFDSGLVAGTFCSIGKNFDLVEEEVIFFGDMHVQCFVFVLLFLLVV